MPEPLISIIVPAYNAQEVIDRSVHSILAQSYKNIEVIIVDDGSTDHTSEKCDEYTKLDERVCVIHQNNTGLSGARNNGVKASRGEYIAFVDSDDYVSPDYIKSMYEASQKDDSELVICGVIRGIDESFPFGSETINMSRCMSAEQMLEKWIEYRHIVTPAWNKLYQKKWYLSNHFSFPLDVYYEDLAVAHLIVSKASKVSVVEENLYYYFQGKISSITHNSKLAEKRTKDWMFFLEAREKWFYEHGFINVYNYLHIKMQKYYIVWFCKLENKSYIRNEALKKFRSNYPYVKGIAQGFADRLFFYTFMYFPNVVRLVYRILVKFGFKITRFGNIHG